jgi:phosphate:Na+ symporter
MIKKIMLLLTFLLLSYGLWQSPDFKEIVAGVAIFLFGMLLLEQGFKNFTGGILERILSYSTNRLWKSLLFGIVSTTLMQSSSLVSILTISFLSAGLLQLVQGIGIIFGANLGTTTGAWLVAGLGLKVDIAAYALPMLIFGVILSLQKTKTAKGLGAILTGLGFLFLGIAYMKEGFEAFRTTLDLSQYAMGGWRGLLTFTGIGIVATIIMQSSHASLILTITALAAGQITYENALALAIGANIGTTITAILGAMGANQAGRQLAGAHLIFNGITGIIAILFIEQFGYGVNYFSDQLNIAPDNYTLKLAVFHTLFNLTGVILMLPLIGVLVKFLNWLIPETTNQVARAKYLHQATEGYPATALEAIYKETRHLFHNAFEIIAHGLNLHRTVILSDHNLKQWVNENTEKIEIDVDQRYEERVKEIYSEIIEFSAKVEKQMEPNQLKRLADLRVANRDIVEAIKDIEQLQENMAFYINSHNAIIRQEYNRLRYLVGEILRAVYAIESFEKTQTHEEDKLSEALLFLDHFRIEMEKNDIFNNGQLDHFIRHRQISSRMATSLMNDSAYAYNIAHKLIRFTKTLYAHQGTPAAIVSNEMSLDDQEIKRWVSQNSVSQ